jgi:hypothetical protein
MTATVPVTATPTAPPQHRARHAASVILIVFVSILTPLVVTAGWAVTTVTNTDRFVSTMSALGTNPTITNYVAAQGAATIVQQVDVQKLLEEKLGSSAKVIAPFLVATIQQQLTKILATVLASPQFQSIWTDKIRLLHEAFVTAMTANTTKVQQASKLALDVTPQLLQAIDALDQRNIHVLDPARKYLTGDKHLLVTLAQGKQFHQVQVYFHLATTLRWALWVATLFLAVFAVLVDPKRRRSGFWLSVGVACSCVVMLALLSIGKQYAMTHSPTPPDVANVIFSTLTSWLRWELRAVVAIGLIAAAVLWFTGPSKHARSLRGVFAKEGGKAEHALESRLGDERAGALERETGTAVDWLGRYATLLAWLGVVIGAIALAAWVDSFLPAVITILLVVAWFASMTAIRRRVHPPAAVDATTAGDAGG